MENKAHALAAGSFVLVVTALLIGLAMWLLRDVANMRSYEIVSEEVVSGLQPQAAVRFKGVTVGKVTRIGFDPTARGQVLVTLAISPDAPISRATVAELSYQGVTGLSFVQLDDDGSDAEPLAPGPNGVPRIPLKPGLLGQLGDRAQDLIGKLDTSAERINQLLAPDKQAVLIGALGDMGGAARSVDRLARTADKTLQAQLDASRTSIPRLVTQATDTLKALQDATTEVRAVVATLGQAAQQTQQGVARVTAPGGVIDRLDDGVQTVTSTTLPRIQGLTGEARQAVRRLDRVTQTLGDNPQALLYGGGAVPPGPGEPGFAPPAAAGVPSR